LTDTLLYQFSAHETKPNILIETTDIAIIPKYVAHHLGISAFPSSFLPALSKIYEITGVNAKRIICYKIICVMEQQTLSEFDSTVVPTGDRGLFCERKRKGYKCLAFSH
jgi:hypothetical protein